MELLLLIIILSLYWFLCTIPYKGEKPKTASSYFIADRSVPFLGFIFAATATSFSGWTFISHPGMIFADGFQASFISFYAITIAFTGVLFLKRQWILGKYYNFITPGDMFAAYFKSSQPEKVKIKWMVVAVALLFSVLYIAVQLRASGYLISTLSKGKIDEIWSTLILALILISYVLPRGLKRVAFVDQLQFSLQTAGIVFLGMFVFHYVGGWEKLKAGMILLSQYDYYRTLNTEYSHYFAIPDIIQTDVWNTDYNPHEAGNWTGMMLLTFMLALMGIQSSPAFTMWAFSSKNPKAFWWQQVIASSLVVGLVLLIFTTIQGMGAHLLIGDSEFAAAHPEIVKPIISKPEISDKLIPSIIAFIASQKVLWLVALFLAIAGLAAMQSTASSYVLTIGGIITRDGLNIRGEDEQQKQINMGRLMSFVVVILAIVLATQFEGQEVALWGGLAVAFGLQMWPALVAVCWWPFLTRKGVIAGLIMGIITVIVTENPFNLFGDDWMRWPLTIHSAAWGLLVNFIVAFVVSCFTQDQEEIKTRMAFHRFLRKYDQLPEHKKAWKPFAWIFVLTWFIFAVGPGAVMGNDFFGNPNDPSSWWFFSAIPIWAWQAMWWILGVIMMWFLAYYLEMSTMSDEKIAALEQEI